jgi:hypothetical protein
MGRDSAIVPAGAAHRSTTGRAGPGEVPNLRLARQSRTGEAIQEWLTRTTGSEGDRVEDGIGKTTP